MKPISAAQHCRPITLSGRIVRLDPMRLEHAPALAEVGMAPELWRLQPAPISSLNDMQAYVAKALDDQRNLLIHAFEGLGVQRVVFKTEALNEQSRRALLRIGAVEEGTFRKHLIAESGRARDMVYFAILDTEWPAARAALASRLR